MPCCGAEPAGAPAILTQRAARGESGRLWRRSSQAVEHLEHLECSRQPHIQGRGAQKRTQRAG